MSQVLATEDVEEIIKRAHTGNARLLDYTVKERAKHGYLGIHLTLAARSKTGEKESEDSFFVKTYGIIPAGKIDFVGETGMFRKEVIFYREVFQEFKNCFSGREWCPKYYLGADRVLVLQDLSVSGFLMKTDGFTLDEDHIKLVLNVLAAFHACSILYEKSRGVHLDAKYPSCFKEILYEENNTNAPSYKWKKRQIRDLLAIVNYLEKYTPQEKELIGRYLPVAMDKIYPLSKKSNRWLNVMVHGDMWSNNIMFRYEDNKPVDCRLVDYQFSRYAPPMHDVMHLLHLTGDKTVRDRMEDALLEIYHESLRQNLAANNLEVNEILPWKTFLESRNSYKLLAIIQSLMSMHYLIGGRKIQDESEYAAYSKSEGDDYVTKAPPNNVKNLFTEEGYTKTVVTILCELIDNYILDEERRASVEIFL